MHSGHRLFACLLCAFQSLISRFCFSIVSILFRQMNAPQESWDDSQQYRTLDPFEHARPYYRVHTHPQEGAQSVRDAFANKALGVACWLHEFQRTEGLLLVLDGTLRFPTCCRHHTSARAHCSFGQRCRFLHPLDIDALRRRQRAIDSEEDSQLDDIVNTLFMADEPPASRGLQAEEVALLPRVPRLSLWMRAEAEPDLCTVCLDPLHAVHEASDSDDDREGKLISLPCRHEFHEACIVRWLQDSVQCPICRCAVGGAGAA